MTKFYVVDSIMGSGKTSAAITKMNEDKDKNFIFITPFLNEVTRIKNSCTERKFYEPENKGKGKLDSLHYLLDKGCNIASTHALFKTYNDSTKELIRLNNYSLILDEVFEVLDKVQLHKDDIKLLFEKGFAHLEDGNYVVWDDAEYNGEKFAQIKTMANSRNLILIDGILLYWNFPVDVFNSFDEVYILTYMFDAQIQKYYYDMNNVKFEYIGVFNNDGIYNFSKDGHVPEYVKTLEDKIFILEDFKLNAIGDIPTSLSKAWFVKDSTTNKSYLIKSLKKNMVNIFMHRFKSSSNENMFTTFLDFKSKLSGSGYTKGFVAVNARATNDFRHKRNLAYCANRYFNPYIKRYFESRGVDVLEDKFALSELVQWIWRSAIRDGNEINLYIPSSRMRGLLKEWLNNIQSI